LVIRLKLKIINPVRKNFPAGFFSGRRLGGSLAKLLQLLFDGRLKAFEAAIP
jgi:hypothetical protein